MRIVALVSSSDHVCARYRMAAFRPFFQRAGHDFQLRSFPRCWWSKWFLGRDLTQADVVIVQRRLLSSRHLALLRRYVRRLVFDFDDAVFLRDSYDPRGLHSTRRLRDFAAMVQSADLVVAGNDYLRDYALPFARTKQLQVIPTCVEPHRYPLAPHLQRPHETRLVWIGSNSTLQGLARIQPLLNRLGAANPGLRLKLICDQSIQLDSLPVEFCAWSQPTEAQELAKTDIGISWLPDDSWSQGKCGLKVLQYMAAGLPVVANPVGVQADFVENEVTGFWAQTDEDWERAVSRLVHDAALRQRLGWAGRCRVERDFPVERGAEVWLDVLEGLVGTRTLARKEAA